MSTIDHRFYWSGVRCDRPRFGGYREDLMPQYTLDNVRLVCVPCSQWRRVCDCLFTPKSNPDSKSGPFVLNGLYESSLNFQSSDAKCD